MLKAAFAIAALLPMAGLCETPQWLRTVQREFRPMLELTEAQVAAGSSMAETLRVARSMPRSWSAGQMATVLDREQARIALASKRLPAKSSKQNERFASMLRKAAQLAHAGDDAAARRALAEMEKEFDEQSVISPLRMQDGPLSERPLRAVTVQDQVAVRSADTPELSASNIVLFSNDVTTRAAALGNSPLRMFAHVQENFEFVPYPEMRQNSITALLSQRGNDFDQATALVALMRASGIPARYVTGSVRVPMAEMMNWIGARDVAAARAIIDRSFLVPVYVGTEVRFNHTWIEANFDAGDGARWYPLDPSFKLRDYPTTIVAPKLLFDRNQFLGTVKNNLASDVYVEQIRAWMRANRPGASFSDLAYVGPVRSAVTGVTPPPLPFVVESTLSTRAEVERTFQNTVVISVYPTLAPQPFLETTLYLPEISHQGLTLSFGPANAFQGTSTNRVPQLRLDEKIIASGNGSFVVGAAVAVQIQVRDFNGGRFLYAIHSSIASTGTGAFTLGGVHVSDGLLEGRTARLLAQPSALGVLDDARLREMLVVTGLRYFQRRNQERQRIGEMMQLRFIPAVLEEGLTLANLTATALQDRPFVTTPNFLVIDLQSANDSVFDLNSATSDIKTIQHMLGATSSGLEHQIWEEIALTPSVSTIKLLQTATEQGAGLRTFDESNSTEITSLAIPDAYKQLMLTAVTTSHTIITVTRPSTYRGYTGIAWISEFSNGVGGYFISQLAGGQATTPFDPVNQNNPPMGDPSKTGGQEVGDPVTVNNGNLFYSTTDFRIAGRLPVLFRRFYNGLGRAESPFGVGWSHSYNASLKDNQTSVRYNDEAGGAFDFTLRGSVYDSAPGLNMTLTKDALGFSLRTKNGLVYRFNPTGRLMSLTDRNDNVVRLIYDAQSRLQTINDSVGRTLTFAYNAQNHVTNISDGTGRSVTYNYDAGGNLISLTDFAGGRTVYAYFSGAPFDHTMKSVTSPKGQTVSWEFYGNSKVSKIIQPGGATTLFLYMPMRNETLVFDERGFPTTYTYNATGNVTRIRRPDGNIVDQVFNNDGKLTSYTDPAGIVRTYDRDANGNITRMADSLGNVTLWTYDPTFNFITSKRDALGNTTRWEYDARGNLTLITPPTGETLAFTYNASGDLLSWRDKAGNTVSFIPDPIGQVTSVIDATGSTFQYTYDSLGRRTSAMLPDGSTWLSKFDSMDRLLSVMDPLGSSESVSYDGNGNPVSSTDANGNVTSLVFDGRRGLTQVTDALQQTTLYNRKPADCGCDAALVLSDFQDPKNQTWAYQYDFANRLTSIRNPIGSSTKLGYDARGNLQRKTDASGNTTTLEYDTRRLLTRKVFPDGTNVRYTYDAAGNMISAANTFSTLTFAYDASNRLQAIQDSFTGSRVGYSFDAAGRIATVTDPEGGATQYRYDGNGRMTEVISAANQSVRFSYDATGRRMQMTHPNGVQTSYTYDAAGRLTGVAAGSVAQAQYTLDANGNRSTKTDGAGTHAYTYDSLNRLTSATHPNADGETYSFDAAGNRAGGSYDAANRLLSNSTAGYGYDANGNRTIRRGASDATGYQYDFENRLVAMKLPSGEEVSFKYDPLGRRVEKNVTGVITRYVYDREKILMEVNASGQRTARYTHGPNVDEPLIVERDEAFHLHADGQGNIVAVTDSSGATQRSYQYDSFGRVVSVTGNVTNPFAFAGREWDAETGLYYFRARYYDPETGTFLSQDPLDLGGALSMKSSQSRAALLEVNAGRVWRENGSGSSLAKPHTLHSYNYAGSNPLSYSDPSGLGDSDNRTPNDNPDDLDPVKKWLDELSRLRNELNDPLNWRSDPKTGLPVFDPFPNEWHFPPPPPPPPPDPSDPDPDFG